VKSKDRVLALVMRLAPNGVCDDCIASTLKSIDRLEIERATREILGQNGLERKLSTCAICGCRKKSTHGRASA
jgi:hypothetical protein